ncbi:MAG: hypothetical protein ACRDL7_15025 [Gaiellaceae bacterium]
MKVETHNTITHETSLSGVARAEWFSTSRGDASSTLILLLDSRIVMKLSPHEARELQAFLNFLFYDTKGDDV